MVIILFYAARKLDTINKNLVHIEKKFMIKKKSVTIVNENVPFSFVSICNINNIAF